MRLMKFLAAAVAGVFTMAALAAEPAAKAGPAAAPAPALVEAPPLLIEPAAIDAALKSLVDSQQIVGVSALVYQRGREVYFGAFGFADRENNKPMARDTIVQILSMTKPVTGVALMKLYERGKFQLDDPLEAYAPEFANLKVFAGLDEAGQPKYEAPKRKPTIRDVLRHTAGFTVSNGDDESVTGAIYREINPRAYGNTLAEFAQKFAQVPLAYQPGTRWAYSNAVDVQAYLVQKISGRAFRQVPRAAHLQAAGHDQHALHHPADRSGPRRSSRPCTRATTMAASRARATRRPTSSTAGTGRSSRATSAWCPPSTTT